VTDNGGRTERSGSRRISTESATSRHWSPVVLAR